MNIIFPKKYQLKWINQVISILIVIAGEMLGSLGSAMSAGSSGLVIGNFVINLLM